MQQAPAPSTDDSDAAGGHKAKILALLGRARVNRGLNPEGSIAAVDPDEVMRSDHHPDATGETTETLTAPDDRGDEETLETKLSLSHNLQNGDTRAPQDEECHVKEEDQDSFLPASAGSVHGSQDILMPVIAPSTNAESLNHRSNQYIKASTGAQSAGETVGPQGTIGPQSTTRELTHMAPTSSNEPTHSRVAVLNSSWKHRTTDLTHIRQEVPQLQQLRALQVPRTHQQPQHEHEDKKVSVKREMPLRSQPKQPRKNSPSTTSDTFMKRLALLTPDDYEEVELHSDFMHALHVLIPSNATGALLERRGQPIQNISQQAECTLSIREPEASPFKDDRVLRIYGKAKCICLAQQLVIAHIRAFRAEKRDPNYMDLSVEAPPVALPATSITKAMSVAVSSGKKQAELEITSPFTWMVQREDVGKMMGKQGCILAAIRQDTGTTIHIEENVVPGTTERRVILAGSIDGITAAMEAIKSKAGGRPEVAPSVANGRLGQYFAIPYHAAGMLIGPHGSTIKNITERSGARLQIPNAEDLPLGSVNRILHMQGTPKQAEHARRIVGGKLRDYLASPKCPRAASPSSTGCKGDKVTVKVLLPSRISGFMLDQRGKLIHEISEKSGAYTHFLASHDEENRICVFSGDLSCVLRAQRLVLQIIAGDAISSKRLAPSRKRKRVRRDDEEEQYEEMEDEDEGEYMRDDVPYYEDENQDEYYDNEYAIAPRLMQRRQKLVRRQPLSRSRHDFDVEDDVYEYNDGMDERVYEKRRRQPLRQRPVAARPREYFEDDYDLDRYDHEESIQYEVPEPRVPKRPTVVQRLPHGRRRADYDDEYGYEYDYEDDDDAEYEQLLLPRKKIIRRRPVNASSDDRRPAPLRPGRKVQMVAHAPNLHDGRARGRPGDQTRTNSNVRARINASRNGGIIPRQNAARGAGHVRPSSARSRSNGTTNKRRRQ